jgi:hypothetical protein
MAEHNSFRLNMRSLWLGRAQMVLNMGQGVYDEEGQPIAIEGCP